MPTYQYQCKSCVGDLEVVQKFSDASLTVCPECSGELRKVFNAVGVVFKGSGFYATDNRTKGASNSANSSSENSSAASNASTSSSSGSTSDSSSGSSSSSSGPTTASSTPASKAS